MAEHGAEYYAKGAVETVQQDPKGEYLCITNGYNNMVTFKAAALNWYRFNKCKEKEAANLEHEYCDCSSSDEEQSQDVPSWEDLNVGCITSMTDSDTSEEDLVDDPYEGQDVATMREARKEVSKKLRRTDSVDLTEKYGGKVKCATRSCLNKVWVAGMKCPDCTVTKCVYCSRLTNGCATVCIPCMIKNKKKL